MTENEYRKQVTELLIKLLTRLDAIEERLNKALQHDVTVLGDK